MGNANLSQVFPGYTGYSPLGIVQGTDITAQSQPLVASSIPSLQVPTSSDSASDAEATSERVVPDWQRRGPVDRTLTRRER
jgi:hypothetical protein